VWSSATTSIAFRTRVLSSALDLELTLVSGRRPRAADFSRRRSKSARFEFKNAVEELTTINQPVTAANRLIFQTG
jgi:hypothetical protein